MNPLIASILSGFIISLLAFVGFGSLLLAKNFLAKILGAIVAFAAGVLLGGAFFHLLPESVEQGGPTFEVALIGILVFFVLDSLLWVYHCHAGHQLHEKNHVHGSCPVKPVGPLNLIGDAIHNFTDGIIIASAFLVSIPLGVVTALAIALHEIPQEISDFGILIYSGYKRKKALILNYLVALTVLLGIGTVFIAENYVSHLTLYTIPFAAGGFLYIATTNLLSEIKEEERLSYRVIQFLLLLVGIAIQIVTKSWLS